MNTCERISAAEQINQLHSRVEAISSQSRTLLDEALSAAWQAGKLLLAEKHRVRKQMDAGSWLLWLEANFKGPHCPTLHETCPHGCGYIRLCWHEFEAGVCAPRHRHRTKTEVRKRHCPPVAPPCGLSNRLVLALRKTCTRPWQTLA
ncbi:hypothetical protein OH491_05220 [Termitidicoccus mucosus]|uniref:hypothetical protein n=1 Tax=Termitidicoccus mucosus TaxID=1184151 RepID=UPI00318304AD